MSDQKLKGGLMIIGSLYWDNDPHRLELREKFLDMDSSKTVDAPIRYGRFSQNRETYTMVFSSGLTTEELGKAKLIPLKDEYCSIENIEEANDAIINAEHKTSKDLGRYNWGWGCLSILLNPNFDNQKISELWNRNFGNGFDPSHYKVGNEQPVVLSNGQLQIPWLESYNDYDFIIVTATKPEVKKYPKSDELVKTFKKDDHYFLGNYENSIRTFQDGAIIETLMESKGYKFTKVGWIPEDWEYLMLKDLGKIGSGTTPSKEVKAYWEGGTIPWLPTGKVNDKIITDSQTFITEKAVEEKRITLLPIGSVVVAMIGQGKTRGKAAILKIRAWLNQNFAYIIPNGEVDSEFLFRLLDFNYGRIRYEGDRGGNQGSLNTGMVKSIRLAFPIIPEQKAIAQVLSTWDKAFENLTQLIIEKQQKKKALMQQLLTGKKRFPRFVQDDGFKESKIGLIPNDWEVLKAKDLFKSVSIKNNGGEELLAVTQDRGAIPRSMLEGRVMSPDGSTSGYKLVVPGNFIISLRSFQGGLEYSEYRGLVSPAYTILEEKVKLDKSYFKYFFKSPEFISRLAVAVIGIRDGKQIAFGDFGFMDFRFPPIEEQQKIAEVLNAATKEIALLNQKLDALKDQKKGLMQQLLTGKKRLKI